ncbi:MAG TPA: dicarboxylate/amino acid:cation symporter [Gemmatimonadales bacterium]|nr:dicarboxylate/amino acid:cation symporter [Gemmatimonadales bacterium]
MWSFVRRLKLGHWIAIAMVAGFLFGVFAPALAAASQPLATIFLRLIKSLIVPLIFSTLAVGIAGHGDDVKAVGRLFLKAMIYFEIVTTLALAVGLVVVNVIRPGVGVTLVPGAPPVGAPPTAAGILEHSFPQSFFEAAAGNEVLQIVIWTVIFAIALTQVKPAVKDRMVELCHDLSDVMFKFTNVVMWYAPIGIGAALAATIGRAAGPEHDIQKALHAILPLLVLVLTLYLALVIFGLAVLLPAALIARVPVLRFVRAVAEPWMIAFSSASSEAALPLAMERMEEFGVPKKIVGFVIPMGYSFNLDGSTLYLAVASIFAAQAAGVHMSLGQQLFMMLTLMLTSKGVAGVPRASLVILAGTLGTFHLPVEAVTTIFGVDVLMDMARTSVNVVGNCLATVVTARWEGEFGPPA